MSYIHQYNITTPLGLDLESTMEAVLSGQTGIALQADRGRFANVPMSVFSENALTAYPDYMRYPHLTRLQRLLYVAVAPLLKDIRITERTGLLLSTTKGDIRSLEKGTDTLPFLHHTAKELAEVLGILTTPMVVSNACVSGVMALSVASRLLEAGVYDSMLIVAGDEVTDFVLSGFNSFQAMSSSPCKPYDANRDGISLGEATAALWLSNEREGAVAKIVGGASINDANHISGPSRTGEGLYLSIAAALQQAGLQPEAIDLINAHGTGTLYNDEMESIALMRSGLLNTPVNSYKGYFGHTLGTSGLLESILSVALAKRGMALRSLNFERLGVSHNINVLAENECLKTRYLLKTASGFGGSNTAVVIEIYE